MKMTSISCLSCWIPSIISILSVVIVFGVLILLLRLVKEPKNKSNKSNKRNWMEIVPGIFICFLVFTFMIIFFLNYMDSQIGHYFYEECNELNGILVFYECYNSAFDNSCNLPTTPIGYYCRLNNGTEIRMEINST